VDVADFGTRVAIDLCDSPREKQQSASSRRASLPEAA
jgi:hypothetical protein